MNVKLGKSIMVHMLDAAVCRKVCNTEECTLEGIHAEEGQICRVVVKVDHMIWAIEEGQDLLAYDEDNDMYFYLGVITMEEIMDEYYDIRFEEVEDEEDGR